MWTRDAIAARVDALASEEGFVEAVKRFSEDLSEPERELLGAVLLQRAGTVGPSLREQVERRGWIQRQLDRLNAPR
jgi:hypothetical protein